MQVSGTLVRYGSAGPQVALLARPPPPITASSSTSAGTARPQPSRAVVLVGGLTDGLLFAPYVVPLSDALTQRGWLVAHASLQSAWQGYGTGSLDRDAADLRLLGAHLRRQHGVTGLVLMGHSTGCQDAVRYAQRYGPEAGEGGNSCAGGEGDGATEGDGPAPELLATILQAPVSDHEWLSQHAEALAPAVARARELVAAGCGEQVVCRLDLADGAPMSAARLLSLHDLGGDDDMFSEALEPGVVQELLGPVGARPCLLLASGTDECVPQPARIAERAAVLQRAIGPSCALRVIEGAPHNLAGCEREAVEAVVQFLEGLGP